jgi:hypothetical protein
MKRIGLLLIAFLLFLVACGSGGEPGLGEQVGDEELFAGASPAATDQTAGATAETATEAVAATPAGVQADDPAQVRERDWKLGDMVDPAVTVIEYGDFQ